MIAARVSDSLSGSAPRFNDLFFEHRSDLKVDLYPAISEFFQRHLNAASLIVDEVSGSLASAVELATEAILEDRKLLSIGLAADCASAIAFSSLLHQGVLRERPALPVVEIAEHQIESVNVGASWAGQRIQALGQPGDVGFVFATLLSTADIQRLSQAAEQRQMQLIWFGSRGPGLNINGNDEAVETRVALNMTLAICAARLIDIYAFGPLEG